MECPDDEGVDLMGDLPGRWLCPACGRGWRLDVVGELVEDYA
jgi:rubredoxin